MRGDETPLPDGNAYAGVVAAASVSHQKAAVDDISAVAAADQSGAATALSASAGVREAFVLQTCNRAEAYVVAESPAAGRDAVGEYAAPAPEESVVTMDHEESLRHLLRVAAGLESLVLGEDQILGQVGRAYEDARGAGTVGPVLEEAVTKAIHVGERVRTETAINEGVVSLGSAAAAFAAERVDLSSATALVVGAGEMGSLAARALADRGVEELLVANRTIPHAEHLAADVDADAEGLALSALPAAVSRADVVVSATASDDRVVPASALEGAGETTVIDVAQPRDVPAAVADVSGVSLHDLDALEAVTRQTRERRREAADAVEATVDEAFDRLLEQYKRKRADEVIATMYESAERVKARELSEALSKLEAAGDLSADQRDVVESLADALVGQLLAAPTTSLRDAAAEDDWTTIHTALQLFDPEFGGPESAPVRPAKDGRSAEAVGRSAEDD